MRRPSGPWSIGQRWNAQVANHVVGIVEPWRNGNSRGAPVDLRMAGGHRLTNQAVRGDRGRFDPQVLLEFDLHLRILSLQHLHYRADLAEGFLDRLFGDEPAV